MVRMWVCFGILVNVQFAAVDHDDFFPPVAGNIRHIESIGLLLKAKQAIRGWSMQPDATQTPKKPFECRVILRRYSKFT